MDNSNLIYGSWSSIGLNTFQMSTLINGLRANEKSACISRERPRNRVIPEGLFIIACATGTTKYGYNTKKPKLLATFITLKDADGIVILLPNIKSIIIACSTNRVFICVNTAPNHRVNILHRHSSSSLSHITEPSAGASDPCPWASLLQPCQRNCIKRKHSAKGKQRTLGLWNTHKVIERAS
ncbi:hypothetical protein L7F22_018779 [Adiantum nelumboides]|nr:hypothetical protein [Adiantum nelumboides]